MSELTYEDYKRRLSIQELLVDAGYRLNRRDGLRYPSYVRIDSDGRRVRGDKFIVTGNGFCCFQPPERKNYNVISFIKEHPHFFPEYTPGMSKDKLVNLVCRRLLNEPQETRETKIYNPTRDSRPFDIGEYDVRPFLMDDWESQKKFWPYFRNRGITLDTQRAFCGHFFLASRHRTDGRTYTNLAFPMSMPAWPGKEIVGLEERSRPDAEGRTAYKGMAAGSNATEGMWIGRLNSHRSDIGFNIPFHAVKDVYWFESAFDALAFYQIEKKNNLLAYADLGNAVFISTGGTPSVRQFSGMLELTPLANHHLCFDRDRAGELYAVNFALQMNGRVFNSHVTKKDTLAVTDLTGKFGRHEIDVKTFDFDAVCKELELDKGRIDYRPPQEGYKDWNDQLLGRRMDMDMPEKGLGASDSGTKEIQTEEQQPRFRR